MADLLRIDDLEIWTRIGVPEEERRIEQRLLLTLEIRLRSHQSHDDNLDHSMDYATVVDAVKHLALEERVTMERLAEDIAKMILQQENAESVRVTVRKFALPGSASAAITIERQKEL